MSPSLMFHTLMNYVCMSDANMGRLLANWLEEDRETKEKSATEEAKKFRMKNEKTKQNNKSQTTEETTEIEEPAKKKQRIEVIDEERQWWYYIRYVHITVANIFPFKSEKI
eukprot:TRINITY_DN3376_c0_g2_i1.p2 TRINITY_DN3376_c0_g2~~TRINITY_DN3376_c0_g2_i1.p2  ORF type:complete len:111 (+),score=19.46 TRINITY_DN3376_c0_g2_i1:3-335(+)